jgi:hypothetical protein
MSAMDRCAGKARAYEHAAELVRDEMERIAGRPR